MKGGAWVMTTIVIWMSMVQVEVCMLHYLTYLHSTVVHGDELSAVSCKSVKKEDSKTICTRSDSDCRSTNTLKAGMKKMFVTLIALAKPETGPSVRKGNLQALRPC